MTMHLTSDNEKNETGKLTPEDIVKRHMQDKDHVISDEEMKNIIVGEVKPEQQNRINEQLDEIEENEGKHKDQPNPYDVLGD